VSLAAALAMPAAAGATGEAARVEAARAARAEGRWIAVIDPGHGGNDPGAPGLRELWEKEVVLDIGRRVAAALEQGGRVHAVLTRDDDRYLSLARRKRLARSVEGDVFLSIHANTCPSPTCRGPELYFLSLSGATDAAAQAVADKENAADLVGGGSPETEDDVVSILWDLKRADVLQKSSRLAERVVESLEGELGITRLSVKQARFAVLRSLAMPSLLAEVGFLTHPEEAALLGSPAYRDRLARALADAIVSFLEEQGPPPPIIEAGGRPATGRESKPEPP
jgi:N-acetylmuramoyl-L-alanine amidase